MEQIKKYLRDNFVSKKVIRNKIDKLNNEKKYYYSDWKLKELDSQIEVLKKLLEENMEEDNYNHIPHID